MRTTRNHVGGHESSPIKREERDCLSQSANYRLYLPCPERQQPSGREGSPLPADEAESSGPRCRRPCPKIAPWGPCGPDRSRQTCLAPSPSRLEENGKGEKVRRRCEAVQYRENRPQYIMASLFALGDSCVFPVGVACRGM